MVMFHHLWYILVARTFFFEEGFCVAKLTFLLSSHIISDDLYLRIVRLIGVVLLLVVLLVVIPMYSN
jgi:hypothetical protein